MSSTQAQVKGLKRLRTIWWMFDPLAPPRSFVIFVGTGMTKLRFCHIISDYTKVVRRRTYLDAYGGAHWRVTDPWLIKITHEHYGRVIKVDDEEKKFLEVIG